MGIDLGNFLETSMCSLLLGSRLQKCHLYDSFVPYSCKKGNLKNGSPLAAKLPKLMSLKRTLYSSSFRHFIEDITGLDRGTLTEQVS